MAFNFRTKGLTDLSGMSNFTLPKVDYTPKPPKKSKSSAFYDTTTARINSTPGTITERSDSTGPLDPINMGTNFFGKPRPGYISPVDIKTGNIAPGFEMGDPRNIGVGTVNFEGPDLGSMEAFSSMRDRAMSQGPSPWLNLQLQQNELDKMGMLDAANQEQAGAQADARAQLAMRGGMSTGARERLAGMGARDSMRATQGIYGAKQGADLSSRLADENIKTDLLKTAAGTEADIGKFTSSGNLDASKTNVANTLQKDMYNTNLDIAAKQYDLGNKWGGIADYNALKSGYYTNDMRDWANSQVAEGMGQGPGGNGILDAFKGGLPGIPGVNGGDWTRMGSNSVINKVVDTAGKLNPASWF